MKYTLLILVSAVVLSCSREQPAPINNSDLCDNPASLSSIAGDDTYLCLIPQKDRKALALYFMSTDCPGCGSWGTTLFHDLLNENKNKIVPMQVHIKYTDPYIVPELSDSLVALLNPNYTPFNMIESYPVTNRFQVNYDFEDAKSKAAAKIDEIIAKPAEVAPALNYKLHKDEIEIHYGVEYLNNSSNEYHFGIYVVENQIEWPQRGQTKTPYFHDNTIRVAAAGAFGIKLNEQAVKEGEVQVGKVFAPLYGFWKKEDIYILGVIWKRGVNGKMEIVNAINFKN